ncbi:MAG TPA: 5'-methylthioadenosine/adenosylhomocysteine nucleosidase [Burkholderiaceae bacterium]|nr:5'-methylthioadenosine/adenosylhomocysteine nucleosidase [Burkholderiaceae bacterium]
MAASLMTPFMLGEHHLTTAILSALPEEQTGLLSLLQNPERTVRAGRAFWRGTLHHKPVVLALSRIGKVAAATTATVLIEHFGVNQILFTGLAGGLADHVQVGDVVVGTHYIQHDLDASPLFPRYEVPSYGLQQFAADAPLLAAVVTAAQQYRADFQGANAFQIHQGLIASGDRFVSSAAEVKILREALPNALCVEMEGAAVAQVCCDFKIPFVAVRTISDRADDTAHVDFASFMHDVAGPYSVGLVHAWMRAR